jgi:cytidylate kinase
VAEDLGFLHVDTGSMYRAFTWKVLEEGVDPHDPAAVLDLMRRVRYECDFVAGDHGPSSLRNRMDGADPGPAIRAPRVEAAVSAIAAIPQVREWMVARQRQLTEYGDLVMEGRDIGTMVFPETPFKFYLDASSEVRARRRAADHSASGHAATVGDVNRAMTERDQKDSTRAVAPLKVAGDAVRMDTSSLDARGVADLV